MRLDVLQHVLHRLVRRKGGFVVGPAVEGSENGGARRRGINPFKVAISLSLDSTAVSTL